MVLLSKQGMDLWAVSHRSPSWTGLQDDALHALKIQSMGVTWLECICWQGERESSNCLVQRLLPPRWFPDVPIPFGSASCHWEPKSLKYVLRWTGSQNIVAAMDSKFRLLPGVILNSLRRDNTWSLYNQAEGKEQRKVQALLLTCRQKSYGLAWPQPRVLKGFCLGLNYPFYSL